MADISQVRRAQAVGRVLWKLGNRHHAVRGGVAAAKTVSRAAVRATRILWLEVTGFFFAVFAIWVIGATWNQWEKIRSGVSSIPTWHIAVGVGFSAILIYFSASSFFRARRAAGVNEDSGG